MSRAKFEAAKELIQAKQYDAARAILDTIEGDPRAKEWLAKLDKIDPPKPPIDDLFRPLVVEQQRQRPKRRGCLRNAIIAAVVLIVIIGAGGLYVVNWGKNISATVWANMTANVVQVTATSLTPVPAKVVGDQANSLILKCIQKMSDGMIRDYDKSFGSYEDAHDFDRMGILASVYFKGACTLEESFQVAWNSYSKYNDTLLRTSIDKGIAWTKFIQGWQFSADMDAQRTATAAAFRSAPRPTEIIATPAP